MIEFADAQLPGETGDAEAARELKSREETQVIQSYVLGGERLIDLWTVSGQVGYSRSSEDNPGGIAGASFTGNDDFADAGFSGTRRPRLSIGSAFYDASNFTLDEVEWEKQKTTDTEKNIRLDLARDYDVNGYWSQVKFGGKLSRRDKDNDLEAWVYEDLDDVFSEDDLNLTQFSKGRVDYSMGNFGPGISAGAVDRLLAGLDRDAYYSEEDSRVNDFDMQEDINAAYLMNTVDIDALRIIAGVRFEGTEFKAKGTGLRDGAFEAVEQKNDYHHWLPGLHLRYQLAEDTLLRAAWTNSVVRPTFGQLAPGFVIDGDEASFGNPTLKPLEAMNLDFGIEHYLAAPGWSRPSPSTRTSTTSSTTPTWPAPATGRPSTRPTPSRTATAPSSTAWNWPTRRSSTGCRRPGTACWSAPTPPSATRVRTSKHRRQRRRIDMPNQSKRVGNLMLGWENDRLSLRLSANYKSDYLAEVAAVDDRMHDLYADAQLFVDFSARYFLTRNLQLSFEAQNLTDESYFVYTGRNAYNAQYEEYGPTYKLGLTLTHF